MKIVRPALHPDRAVGADRTTMKRLQRRVRRAARFTDALPDGVTVDALERAGAATTDPDAAGSVTVSAIAGVDQAFHDDRAVSAVVVRRGPTTVRRGAAVRPLRVPYVPGYLAFREGGPALAALRTVDAPAAAPPDAIDGAPVTPAVVLVDGSGRLHPRQAGLATHLGVVLDVPTVGVAKGLLCGTPARPVEGGALAAGERVPIRATVDDAVAPAGTLLGYAVQTRQYATGDRYINPVYVSPGHRVSADTAARIVAACCDRYKLPTPIRAADRYAADRRDRLDAAGSADAT